MSAVLMSGALDVRALLRCSLRLRLIDLVVLSQAVVFAAAALVYLLTVWVHAVRHGSHSAGAKIAAASAPIAFKKAITSALSAKRLPRV